MSYTDNEKPKPIVFYTNRLGSLRVGQTTVLTEIRNHPILDAQHMVRTSTVIDIRDDGNTIETLNTIYKLLEG